MSLLIINVRLSYHTTMVSAKQVALAAAMLSVCGLSHAESNITSDTFFYGQSEPVYPSRMVVSFLGQCVSVS